MSQYSSNNLMGIVIFIWFYIPILRDIEFLDETILRDFPYSVY